MILDGELLDLLEKLAIKAGVSPSERLDEIIKDEYYRICLLYTSPSPRDGLLSRMPSSA